MEGLLARLERRFGRFAIQNLTLYLVVLTGLVFVMSLAKPAFLGALFFDADLVVHRHQYWRVVTFLFMPGSTSPIWIIFELWMLWWVGNSLQAAWGALKFNLYYFLGAIAAIVASFALGIGITNEFLNVSLFLAFATIFPDYQVLLIVFPVRAKWLGMISAGFLAYRAYQGTMTVRIAIVLALSNYFLFFSGHLINLIRGRASAAVAPGARKRAAVTKVAEKRPTRTCTTCGLSDDDPGADLRVCTCQAVCHGKPTVYCLEHARSHTRAQA